MLVHRWLPWLQHDHGYQIYIVNTTASITIAESATKKTKRELSSLGSMYVWLYQHYQPSLLPLLPSVLSPPNSLTVTSIFLTFYRYHPYPFFLASIYATYAPIAITANIASTPNPTAIRNIMEHRDGGSQCGCSHEGREYSGPCWALGCACDMYGVLVSDWMDGEEVSQVW